MEIVPLNELPKVSDIQDVPVDNLMKIYKVCLDMEVVCSENNGIGLSAIQVGIPWKLFIVKNGDKYDYYVNCTYESLVDVNCKHFQSMEGCLSLRNTDGSFRQFLVERFPKIRIKGKQILSEKDLILQDIDMVLENDYSTIVMQHEIDHHLGILISDIGKEMEISSV